MGLLDGLVLSRLRIEQNVPRRWRMGSLRSGAPQRKYDDQPE